MCAYCSPATPQFWHWNLSRRRTSPWTCSLLIGTSLQSVKFILILLGYFAPVRAREGAQPALTCDDIAWASDTIRFWFLNWQACGLHQWPPSTPVRLGGKEKVFDQAAAASGSNHIAYR